MHFIILKCFASSYSTIYSFECNGHISKFNQQCTEPSGALQFSFQLSVTLRWMSQYARKYLLLIPFLYNFNVSLFFFLHYLRKKVMCWSLGNTYGSRFVLSLSLTFIFLYSHYHLHVSLFSIYQSSIKHPLKPFFLSYCSHYKISPSSSFISHHLLLFNLNPIHTHSLSPSSPLWSVFSPPLVSSDNNWLSEVMGTLYLGQFCPLHQNQERSVSCFPLSWVPMGSWVTSPLFLIILLYLSIWYDLYRQSIHAKMLKRPI